MKSRASKKSPVCADDASLFLYLLVCFDSSFSNVNFLNFTAPPPFSLPVSCLSSELFQNLKPSGPSKKQWWDFLLCPDATQVPSNFLSSWGCWAWTLGKCWQGEPRRPGSPAHALFYFHLSAGQTPAQAPCKPYSGFDLGSFLLHPRGSELISDCVSENQQD